MNTSIFLRFKCNGHFITHCASKLALHHVNGALILMKAKRLNRVIQHLKSI